MKKAQVGKHNASNALTEIPFVGNAITNDFKKIGITKISDLKGKKPEELYSRICAKRGCQVDRCVLYVCRSSIYFSENKNPDPEKIKWWNWTGRKIMDFKK
jgi:hypothetical protein